MTTELPGWDGIERHQQTTRSLTPPCVGLFSERVPHSRLSFLLPLALSVSPVLFARVSDAFLEAEAKRFFSSPAFHSVTINHAGSAMAMIKRDEDREFLAIYDFVEEKGRQHMTRPSTSTYSFDWIDDRYVLVCYVSDRKYFDGLYVIDSKSNDILEVGVPPEEAMRRKTMSAAVAEFGGVDQRILVPENPLPYTENEAIVFNLSSRPFPQLMRFNAARWSLKSIDTDDEEVIGADFDLQGRYRLRFVRDDTPDQAIFFHRKDENSPWEPIDLPAWLDSYGFDPSGNLLYITYPIDGKRVMQGFNVGSNQLTGGKIEDPVYDIIPDLIRDPGNGKLLGIHYEADKPVVKYFDPDVAKVMNLVQRSFLNEAHRFLGLHASGGILFASWGDRCPYKISRLDLETMELSLIGSSRPEIDSEKLGHMYPFFCEARDGMTIRGYYTLPLGQEEKPAKPLPTVVLIHGGPRARDFWEFNSEVQFLARMGYAVLQVNYRGSDALYGVTDLTLLDACRFGPKDVADATRWAIGQGIADPKRIAISGGSFGGFIALSCAEDEPDLYKCAVGVAGVYDFDRQIVENMRDPSSRRFMEWRQSFFGDLETNRAEYQKVSPINRASSVKIPVYLLHGGADDTVFRSQSTRMERALREGGVEVEIDTPTWYGHGALFAAQNIKYNQRIYRFLEKHLGAAAIGEP